ncbi:MAG: ribulose-phosphate 3-epimerase [Puniceicoccales bacterium]|jgi:ribulose-phosphate 3-epimerase|nr:ribulose-phosphate 3-epimerase [Puniceicoccales bacterium]
MVDICEDFTARIVPSALGCGEQSVVDELLHLCRHRRVPWLHFDVIDGQFAPSFGLPIVLMQRLRKIFRENAIPSPKFDVHFMVNSPRAHVSSAAAAAADRITIHCECDSDEVDGAIEEIQSLRIPCAIAVNPSTDLMAHWDHLLCVDSLLCMGVTPGFCGQSLIPAALDNVRAAVAFRKAHGLNFSIGIDGGINRKTLSVAAACGADFFVAGSAIFRTSDPAAALDELGELVEKYHGFHRSH